MCIVPRVTVKVLRSAKGEKRNKTTRQLDAYMVKNNEKVLQNPQPKSGRGRLCVVVACLREINYNHRV